MLLSSHRAFCGRGARLNSVPECFCRLGRMTEQGIEDAMKLEKIGVGRGLGCDRNLQRFNAIYSTQPRLMSSCPCQPLGRSLGIWGMCIFEDGTSKF